MNSDLVASLVAIVTTRVQEVMGCLSGDSGLDSVREGGCTTGQEVVDRRLHFSVREDKEDEPQRSMEVDELDKQQTKAPLVCQKGSGTVDSLTDEYEQDPDSDLQTEGDAY